MDDQLTKDLENVQEEKKKMKATYKRQQRQLEAQHNIFTEINKRKHNLILTKHTAEKKSFEMDCAKQKEMKKSLKKKLKQRVGQLAPPSPRPPANCSTLIPECPVCCKDLAPSHQIFTCGNGHLICSLCRPMLIRCYCQALYTGRATDMEQMIRQILGIV